MDKINEEVLQAVKPYLIRNKHSMDVLKLVVALDKCQIPKIDVTPCTMATTDTVTAWCLGKDIFLPITQRQSPITPPTRNNPFDMWTAHDPIETNRPSQPRTDPAPPGPSVNSSEDRPTTRQRRTFFMRAQPHPVT
jgi:hypothetical protein